jgi:hypothetical protein
VGYPAVRYPLFARKEDLAKGIWRKAKSENLSQSRSIWRKANGE